MSPARARAARPGVGRILLILVVLVAGACDPSVPPTQAPVLATPIPTPDPSTSTSSDRPFSAMAYPPGGDAPCGQTDPPDAAHGPYTGDLKRIIAQDPTTVVFELCRPDAAFLSKVASPAMGIEDAGWLRTQSDAGSGGAVRSNGTGPFRLERWTPGTEISLARNDGYWGPRADAERLIVRWDTDPGARVAELQAGSVDGIDEVDAAGVATAINDVSLSLVPRSGLETVYLGFDVTQSPYGSEQVRRAIALALDRQHINDTMLPAGSEVASHYTPCAIPHGCAGESWYGYDPTLADETLAGAGYTDGFDTSLHYPTTGSPSMPDPAAIAQEIQAELLDNLAINVELVPEPADTYLADLSAGKIVGLHLMVGDAAYPDVGAYLDPQFGSGASAEFGTPFDDVTKALAAGAATANDDKRETAYANANDAIRTHVPMVPIAHVGSVAAFRADVDGATTSPLRLERFARMTPGDRRQFVWLTTSEPTGPSCADALEPVSMLVCSQLVEGLYAYAPTGAAPVPNLAKRCVPNKDLTVWTCTLRPGITFHDGARFEADDVALSYAIQWDANHPLHAGQVDGSTTFTTLFGGYLHPPPPAG